MTAEQADWMRAHPNYRATGTTAGFSRYVKRGILHADGTFEETHRGVRPRVTAGCFEVGIFEAEPHQRQ